LGWLSERPGERLADRHCHDELIRPDRVAHALVRMLQERQGDPDWPPGKWVEENYPSWAPQSTGDGGWRLTLTRSVYGIRVVVAYHHRRTGQGFRRQEVPGP